MSAIDDAVSTVKSTFNKVLDRDDKTLSTLIPLATFEGEAFRLQDGSYLDMVQIVTKDLINMSSSALAYDNMNIATFLKKYGDDIKYVALNFPKDTKLQQRYYHDLVERERNPVYKELLKEQLATLKEIEKMNTEREYYIFFFAKNVEDWRNKQMQILHSLDQQVIKIPNEKKLQILYKINNKNSRVFI